MPARRLLVACYGASGAAALIYQVAWVRTFTLAFGHTTASSSIVLSAFMCGLALGAWIAGRMRLSPSRALAAYALLELVIAGTAIALPTLLELFEPLLKWAYADGASPLSFSLVRVSIGFALLGLPAAAMGATFPVAVAWFAGQAARESQRTPAPAATEAGILYAVNTTGAAAGALAAGFWLIPAYGVRTSTWIAVVLNVLAAAGAMWIRRSSIVDRPASVVDLETGSGGVFGRITSKTPPDPVSSAKKRHSRRSSIDEGPSPINDRRWPIIAAAVSGFAALVFEVAWTRLIALIVGPTTYAFAIMAASFIVGIAAGSTIGVRIARKNPHHVPWLAGALVLAAAGTIAAAWFAALELPLIVARSVSEVRGFGPLLLREVLALGLLLTSASAAFGTTFTLALAAASRGTDSAARDTSLVYTANTIGAVAGSLAGGFVLLPRFGLASTFLYAGRLLLVAGMGVALAAVYGRAVRGRGAAKTATAAALILVATFLAPEWNRALLAGGLYKYARQIVPGDLDINLRAGRLEYYKEGAAGTVSVKLLGGTRSLAIDGKVDASNGGDMLTQRLLGLLPAVLHGRPRDALVIGLGSGVTADAVMASGTVSHLDVVEISPEVVEASALFETENRQVLAKPEVRLLKGDGRTHLQLTSRQYDVIVSEPSNPWMAGVAALFTREFFAAVRERLTPSGVFCQWAHTYEIAAEDLQSIAGTFVSVFPQGTVWLVGDSDLLFIGTQSGGLDPLLARLAEHAQRGKVPALLAEAGVPAHAAPFFLLSLYAGGPADLVSYGRSAPVQSDDRMTLEFTAARAMYAPPEGNAPALRALAGQAQQPEAIVETLRTADAEDWVLRGEAGLKAEAFGMAHESFRRASGIDGGTFESMRGGVTSAAAAGRLTEETQWLRQRVSASPHDAPALTALSYALALTGEMKSAVNAASEAVSIAPDRPQPLEQLASVLADLGEPRLASVADSLMRRFPMREDSRFYQATALFLENRHDEAERAIKLLIDAHPRHARALNMRGIICASRKDHACAIGAFEDALRQDPRDSAVYVNLGNVHLERGDVDTAAELFRDAVALDPGAEAARTALRTMSR